jgi:hypothetical protein
MKPWSKLTAQEKQEWLWRARREAYPGLEPADPVKEAAIPGRAREIYYASFEARC